APLDQPGVVGDEDLGVGHDLPVDAVQELELEEVELGDLDAPDAGVGRVVPEGVRQPLGGDGGGGDEEAVHGEGVDGEVGVERAQAVDVVDHGEEEGRGQGGVLCQAV